MKFYIKLGINLMIFCAIAAAGLAVTYSLTKNAINTNAKKKQDKANKAAVLEAETFKAIGISKKIGEVTISEVFVGKKGTDIVGYAVNATTRGYGGAIQIVVGITKDKKVIAISVVSQNETPGLGNKITDTAWQKQFAGKGSKDKFEVKKDVEAVTGATISSKAVTRAVKAALQVKI